MRRKDRELSKNLGLEIIDKAQYAVISCVDNDKIFSIPISIVREGDKIYIHGAPTGTKARLFKNGKEVVLVCVTNALVPKFSQDEIDLALKENRVSNIFTTEYKSVVANVLAYEVSDEMAKIHALRLLCEKYTPEYMHVFNEAIKQSLARTNIYELLIVSVSAKAKIL